MSALITRLNSLHQMGHARGNVSLHQESRFHDNAPLVFTPAAVLVAITDGPEPALLLTHRPETMRSHPGQIAFPGGKCDPGEDAGAAALREAHEELGIDPEVVQIIGMSDPYRTHSGFEITPVIAVIPDGCAIQPNPDEVASWFAAPVDFVLDPANQQQVPVEWQGQHHTTWQINWQEHRIWGVTAGLLVNLSRRLLWHG